MTYLDESVTEIPTDAEHAAFLIVQETDVVEINHAWDAKELAERFYRRERRYSKRNPIQSVAEEVDDGWAVMIMEDNPLTAADGG